MGEGRENEAFEAEVGRLDLIHDGCVCGLGSRENRAGLSDHLFGATCAV